MIKLGRWKKKILQKIKLETCVQRKKFILAWMYFEHLNPKPARGDWTFNTERLATERFATNRLATDRLVERSPTERLRLNV